MLALRRHLSKFIPFASAYVLPTGLVLLFLLLWIKSQAVDSKQHQYYVTNLRQIQEMDARINQNVLQTRLGLLPDYDPIVNQLAELRQIQAELQQVPWFIEKDGRQEIGRAIKAYIQVCQEKEKQIEQFKSTKAILSNSLAYFPTAIEDLTQNQTISHNLADNLRILLRDILLFNLSTSQELNPQIQQEIQQILTDARNWEQSTDVEQAMVHARMILKQSSQVNRLVNSTLALPTRTRGEEIAQAYYSAHEQALDTADRYRQGLYLLSTVVILTIAVSIICKLRSSAIALEQSESKLRMIFENSQVGIFRVSQEDNLIIDANQRLVSMLGYHHATEVIGHKYTSEFYADQSQQQKADKILQALGEIHNFEFQLKRRDGKLFWGLLSARLNSTDNCVEGVIADISDRRQAESALQASEMKFRNIFENSQVGIFRTRFADGLILDANQHFATLMGHSSPSEIIGHKRAFEYYVNPNVRFEMLEILRTAGEVHNFEAKFRRRDGSVYWGLFSARLNASGGYLEGVHSDISARKQAEAALKQAKVAAEEANQAKSRFLSHMSHELRTPLSVILGFTQLLNRSTSLDSKQQEYLDTISRSGEHLLTLINDVLEMTRIEANKITLNEQDCNLYYLLDGLEQMFQFKATSKKLQFIVERSPDVPEYIRTDESKLRQVLFNLVGNAVKFTQTGSVTLRLFLKPPSHLYFEVEDTGPGIAQSELDQLFEPFVQTETGRNSQEGTGLGLPISRKFVQLMGGNMTFDSCLGKGSCFRFYIPVQNIETSPMEVAKTYQQVIGVAPGQSTYRILIVEDKPRHRQLLVELLKPVGFDVQEAENGIEAIALCRDWCPHLVWMDLLLPLMDGYEATKQIKSIKIAPIIIALTGSAFEQEYQLALDAGCDDFVRKPYRAEVIYEKIAEHLGVRYVYSHSEVVKSTKDEKIPKAFSLEPSSLEIMSPEWIKQMNQAAICVNSKLLYQLIQQIPSERATVAKAIAHLIDNFQFEEIINLTKHT